MYSITKSIGGARSGMSEIVREIIQAMFYMIKDTEHSNNQNLDGYQEHCSVKLRGMEKERTAQSWRRTTHGYLLFFSSLVIWRSTWFVVWVLNWRTKCEKGKQLFYPREPKFIRTVFSSKISNLLITVHLTAKPRREEGIQRKGAGIGVCLLGCLSSRCDVKTVETNIDPFQFSGFLKRCDNHSIEFEFLRW